MNFQPYKGLCIEGKCSSESVATITKRISSNINPNTPVNSILNELYHAKSKDLLLVMEGLNKAPGYLRHCEKNNILIGEALGREILVEDSLKFYSEASSVCNSSLKASFLLNAKFDFKMRSTPLSDLCLKDSNTLTCIDTIGLIFYRENEKPREAESRCESAYKKYSKMGFTEMSHDDYLNGCFMGYIRASWDYGFWSESTTVKEGNEKLCRGLEGEALNTCKGDMVRYRLNGSKDLSKFLGRAEELRVYCQTFTEDICGPYEGYASVDFLKKFNVTDQEVIYQIFKATCLALNSEKCIYNFIGWYGEFGSYEPGAIFNGLALQSICPLLPDDFKTTCLSAIKFEIERHASISKVAHQ